MEYGRFEQLKKLKAKGWTELSYLRTSLSDELICGGPTLMYNDTDKKLYNVSCGREWPYEGDLYDTYNKKITYINGISISA